ncbi:UNVERIFIED_CONTAM: hypothetical protein HDU68_006323, partial [Siphonaria sp. JEL0065]
MQRNGSITRKGSIRRGNKPTVSPKTYDMLDGLLSAMEVAKAAEEMPVKMERLDSEDQSVDKANVEVLGDVLAAQPPMIGVLSKLFKQGDNGSDGWKDRFFVLTKEGKLVVFKSNGSMGNTAIASLPVTSCSVAFDHTLETWILTVLGDSN